MLLFWVVRYFGGLKPSLWETWSPKLLGQKGLANLSPFVYMLPDHPLNVTERTQSWSGDVRLHWGLLYRCSIALNLLHYPILSLTVVSQKGETQRVKSLWQLQFLYNLRRLTPYTRSSSISSFWRSLSNLKWGQQYLGALVAVVRSNRFIYGLLNTVM